MIDTDEEAEAFELGRREVELEEERRSLDQLREADLELRAAIATVDLALDRGGDL